MKQEPVETTEQASEEGAAAWKRQDRRYHELPHIAESYDRRVARFYRLDHRRYTLEPWKQKLLDDRSTGTAAGPVLDFGCGTGHATFAFAAAGFAVVSVDASFAMLRRVQAKARRRGVRVSCVLADGDRLPFRDGAFAAVVCTGVLHHMPDPAGGARSQARVLGEGARLFISEPYAERPLLSRPGHLLFELARRLRDVLRRRAGGEQARERARERALTREDLDAVTAALEQEGFRYTMLRFSYWPYLCGFLPEALAWPLMRLLDAVKAAERGDAVKIEALRDPVGAECGR